MGFSATHEHPGVLREFVHTETNSVIIKGEKNSVKILENKGKPTF
jgi:hypothetical protein